MSYEDSPPKQGVTTTLEAAAAMIHRHTGQRLVSLVPTDRGYNNRLYMADLDSGRQVVIKLCGRFWHKTKTETEVVALSLARAYTNAPVPRVLAWSASTEELGAEFIVLEHMPGSPLDQVWKTLDINAKVSIVKQIASIVVSLKTSVISNDGLIGNLKITASEATAVAAVAAGSDNALDTTPSTPICTSEEVIQQQLYSTDKTVEHGIGPFPTHLAYIKAVLQREIHDLETMPVFACARPILPRLGEFVRSLDSPSDGFPTCQKVVFIHGDMNMQNILIDLQQCPPKVVAILDWEWSGFFPEQDEYFGSFDFLDLEGDLAGPDLTNIFFDCLEAAGLETPRTIRSWDMIVQLTSLRENIAHWALKLEADPSDPNVQERVMAKMTAVDKALKLLTRI
ncbi:hypothetical protein BASA50_007853 [Batrachochytrium salamandrivorans]|uniref:Aminoglycoside phosphotransferase domain-containing protein n=1 Tax=Batrachochytrium salamandrivorans TaxID=1357716 RepID=A0ABQ8F6A9_9FUNG|nr:hypothetical protein BASA62_007066 [Batrachochytrium salamandrivorans]KAH6592802.1 hypothetical protein BASA50_007853 [Batrachochytrium salamandrivorans]KAH9272643.1 hypothetical protein BASA83_005149 [Batrachochytrium salamandrivorans]